MGLTGLYIYMVYQRHQSNKEYLIFQLNSGDNYSLYFQDAEFLNKVRNAVEAAFNHKNMYSEINIAEQKIIQGNHHVIHGNQGISQIVLFIIRHLATRIIKKMNNLFMIGRYLKLILKQ